jgi:hypothetical protein
MSEVSTRFFAAVARIRSRIPRSDNGRPNSSGALSRMSSGTVASISASRLGAPTTRSISAISSGEGPI